MFKDTLLAMVALALLATGKTVHWDYKVPVDSPNPPKPVPAGDRMPGDPPQADYYSGPADLATMDVLLKTFRKSTVLGETVSLLLNSYKGETTAIFKLGTTTGDRRRRSTDDDDEDDDEDHDHDHDRRRRSIECNSGEDCPADAPVCSDGFCTAGRRRRSTSEECSSTADCPAEGQVCSDGYCTAGRRRRSTTECSEDADCLTEGQECSNGYCTPARRRRSPTAATGSTTTTTTTTGDRRRRSATTTTSSTTTGDRRRRSATTDTTGSSTTSTTTTGDRRRRSATTVGEGECSSNADCPAEDPICSEYGYCQCSTYVPGGPAC